MSAVEHEGLNTENDLKRPEDLCLVGVNTKEEISLGPGYRNWRLLDYRGPVVQSSRLGAPSGRPRLVLPRALLILLYERFAQANPSGCHVVDIDEMFELIFTNEQTEEERDRLWEAGEAGWNVFDWRIPPHGRDPIRRYLPELFDPEVLQSILADPRLDMDQRAPHAPAEYEDFWQDRSRHFRWSEWWNRR